ncbi:proteoglycan 4 [Melanaphis sacchari]|uniref:proteoglycan 4 n=1 Tax=Melanaphis sacchari TaxID=742174 RepID=UPI000DC15766|nr:proteoglycan 4 [Melanaphis sacchari]XP_025200103.1 proteoglycan 4 [Melanaphis sacchari]
MGARQSKRSVDISAGATKAEKGAAGEPLENGTITTASADEKQVVEANGGVEETTKQNGSTPHIDEKEIAETEDVKEPVKTEEEKTEVVAPISEANGDVDTVADESSKTPTDEATSEEVQASAEKKRKKKKSWSFRSISFSKKDKSKPVVKEQTAVDVKNETVEEVAEEEAVKETVKVEPESAVEVPKTTEEPPSVVEEKEPETVESNITNVAEIPPPLPSSPPPVEATPVAPTPTIVETPAPVQPVEPEVVQGEPEDETVGGGEGLAEPPEGLNTSDIEKEVAEVPLVNGNHVESEKSEPSSPDVNSLSEKIEAIKLSNAADINEATNEISNDLHEVNGVCDAIAVTTNGDAGHEEGN